MAQTIELLKNVPITNTIIGLETLLTELCEKAALDLDETKQIYIDSLTITGDPALTGIDALTLSGEGIDYFSPATHNHDLVYLGINATAVNSDLLENQNSAYYLNWDNFTNTPATYTPSSHTHVIDDLTDIDTYLSTVSASKTSTEGQTVFSLTTEWPDEYYSLTVFRNGLYQLQGSDFSIDAGNKTITFLEQCEAGEDIIVLFNVKLSIDIVGAHEHDDRYVKYNSSKLDGYFYSGTSDPTNSTRINYDGYLYATRVYNAVYNDLAECFIPNENIKYEEVKNRIVQIDNVGNVDIATEESDKVIGIVSDSYGLLLGGSEEEIINNKKIPVGLTGTLWVLSESKVSELDISKFICSGFSGTARVIPKNKINKHEGQIVGKIIAINKNKNMFKILLCIR